MASKAIREGLELFLLNGYWRKFYETAPSELCEKYIEYKFANSRLIINGKELIGDDKKEWDEIADKLSREDWEHLRKYTGSIPFKDYCTKRIEKLAST